MDNQQSMDDIDLNSLKNPAGVFELVEIVGKCR